MKPLKIKDKVYLFIILLIFLLFLITVFYKVRLTKPINYLDDRNAGLFGNGEKVILYNDLYLTDEFVLDKKSEKYSGKAIELNSSGKLLSVKSFKNGKEDGLFLDYFDNGKVWRQRAFKKGIPEGDWFSIHQNGNVILKKYYKNGKLLTLQQNYINGLRKYKAEYDVNGKQEIEIFFANGKATKINESNQIKKNKTNE